MPTDFGLSAIASEIKTAQDTARQIEPFTHSQHEYTRHHGFDPQSCTLIQESLGSLNRASAPVR